MSTGSAPDSQSSGIYGPSDAPEVFADAAGSQSGDRFARILEQILAAPQGVKSVDLDSSHADLLRVAEKYSTMEFCVDPVLLELVRVLTRKIAGVSEARLARLEHTVSKSLADDQVSLQRLQHLWGQLKGLVSNAG